MMLYELAEIQMRFGSFTALDIDSLTLHENTACALLGPNGSGKTTLLHILAMLKRPTSGLFRFMGEAVVWREKRLLPLRRKVVLVDQHPIMFSKTVLNNVAYGLKIRGEARSAQKRIVMECLDRVGMSGFAARPAHRLSGGETQRVAIARALACSPRVLLLDEPTAGVDIENQVVVEKIINDLCSEKNMSILFSTHNPLQAERLSRRKVFLSAGRLAAPDTANRFLVKALKEKGIMELMTNMGNFSRIAPVGSFISIDPEKIRIYAKGHGNQGCHTSRLPAKVLQMNADTDRIRVVLDVCDGTGDGCGIQLTAIAGAEEIRHTHIIPGDTVQLAFDTDATVINYGKDSRKPPVKEPISYEK